MAYRTQAAASDATAREYDRAVHRADGPKRPDPDKVLAGRKGGRNRAERQRLILEQGPTGILTALNELVRMILAGEDLWSIASVRRLHRALGKHGDLFVGENMPTPAGDELAQYAAIMVLAPMVSALSEIANMIGPRGIVKDVNLRASKLQAEWQHEAQEIERQMWNDVNPGISPAPTLLNHEHTEEERTEALRMYRAYTVSPRGAPIMLLRWNLFEAGALLSRFVGAPQPWVRSLFRCERFPGACHGEPYCLRLSNNQETRRCPRCGRQGKRARQRRLGDSSRTK